MATYIFSPPPDTAAITALLQQMQEATQAMQDATAAYNQVAHPLVVMDGPPNTSTVAGTYVDPSSGDVYVPQGVNG